LDLKILYCSQGYSPHDFRFLSALAESEHEIHWLRLERNLVLENRPLAQSIHLVEWKGDERRHPWREYKWLKEEFQKAVNSLQPDIIHSGPIQKVAFLAALINFHPLISMSWGTDLLMDADRNFIWQAITRFTLKRSDWLIGDCLAVQRKAEEFGFPPTRTTIFPWGIDLRLFQPKSNPNLRRRFGWQDKFVILCTRNWEPRYGVDLVVRAFCRIAYQMKDAVLVLVGGGSQEEMLRKMAAESNLDGRVYFAGRIDYAELPQYYKSADLYISASHSDGSSVSLLEALGCGCPVLVSDIAANREWVESGIQGWLFKDGDWQEMAEKMFFAFNERDKLIPIRQNARKTAIQKADWRKNFQSLLLTYQMVRKPKTESE